jgi:FkbM family methyltransferase
LTNLAHKTRSLIEWTLSALYARLLARDFFTGSKIHRTARLEEIGSRYGGWIIPVDFVREHSICYCVGVGEDITFDLRLIERFGCLVYAFDPTPRAQAHVQTHARGVEKFRFFATGLWNEDRVMRFYAHANPASPSYSLVNLHRTDRFFEAHCKRLSAIMREHGHRTIDLLKLDIEGAEYGVIDSLIEDRLDVGIICVEYDEVHSKRYAGYLERMKRSVARLQDYGYALVALKPKCNYTFVRKDLLAV